MDKQKIFSSLGWLLIAGGIIAAILSYWAINSQEFVVALLARVVENPFEYRQVLALASAVMIALVSWLIGLVYLGLAEVMRRKQ